MQDGLYQVAYKQICTGFVVEQGRVTDCAPVLVKRIDYWKTIAKRVEGPMENSSEQELEQQMRDMDKRIQERRAKRKAAALQEKLAEIQARDRNAQLERDKRFKEIMDARARAGIKADNAPIVPDKKTGMYKAHVVHHGLGLEFDVLLNPECEGAEILHGAVLTVR